MKTAKKKQIAPPLKAPLDGVRCSVRFPEHGFILQLEPTGAPESIARWVQRHEKFIGDATLEYGGILFHGFDLDVASFRRLVGLLSDEIRFEYIGGTGPRERYSDDVYVSTYAPPGAKLAQHHEMAYMPSWPMKVFFYCDLAPRKDGETLLCSSRSFQRSLDPSILERFHDREVLYIRNYDPPTDLKSAIVSGWQLSFNTSDKGKVSEICRDLGLEAEWRGERLRTRNIAQGAAHHPITGELLLHNQSYLRTMASDVRGAMTPAVRLFEPGLSREQMNAILTLAPDEQSTNAFYGDDGALIEQSILEEIHGAFEANTVKFPWQKGDFVMLDNMLSYHGRNSFEGERRILTVLKERHGRSG